MTGARLLERSDAQSAEATGSRARRWRHGWRGVLLAVTAVVAALAVAVGVGWLLLVSTVFDVRTVRVIDAGGLAPETVLAAAAVPTGEPVLRADTRAAAGRVLALPGIAEVSVARRLPHTISIRVTARTAVAVLRSADGRSRLVDASATVWEPAGPVPGKLPVLLDRDGTLDATGVRTAVNVATSLPPELGGRVRSLRAAAGASVSLVLSDGRVVVWGDAADTARKARVATALLAATRARYLDVSVPAAPVTSATVPGNVRAAG